jgi:putative ABC transport system ATP-binding protein
MTRSAYDSEFMNASSDTAPAHAPRHGALARATLALLVELGRETGSEVRSADAADAMGRCTGEEPLELLAAAAAAAGLHVTPYRLSVRDAVWLADDSAPFVAWSAVHGCWVAVTRHGALRARVWTSDRPEEPIRSMGRGELARFLGAPSAQVAVDFAYVRADRPADGLRAADGHDGVHAHGDHEPTPIRRLVGLMRPEMPDVWAIAAFSAITGLLYLALPLAVNAFVSNLSFGAQQGPFMQALLAIAGVLLICLAIGAAIRWLQHVAVEVIQRRLFVRIAADLSHRLPNVELESLDRVHAPELVNRFLEVITVQKSASLLLLNGINLVLSTLIGLTVLAFYHPFLLAFSIALLAALAGVVFLAGRQAIPTSIRESRRKYEMIDWLEELARHPRLFKGAGGPELALARADDLARGYLSARQSHFRILLRQVTGLLALEVVAATALLAGGGWLVLNQQLTIGQLVAAELIVAALVNAISKLGKQFEAWYDAVAAVDKLGHLSDLALEREGGDIAPAAPRGSALQLMDVARTRPGGLPGLQGVSFAVEPGERLAILGARGSGTSALLELAVGFRRPTAGAVAVDGLDVRAWDLRALRDRVSLLRANEVFGGTIAENIRLGRTWMPMSDVQRAIDRVGLGPAVRLLPDGLATPLLTGGLPLTGRQRARLVVARALAARPSLVLVDELLDGLDESTTEDLLQVLLDPSIPWTVIVATRHHRVAARFPRTLDLPASEGGPARG